MSWVSNRLRDLDNRRIHHIWSSYECGCPWAGLKVLIREATNSSFKSKNAIVASLTFINSSRKCQRNYLLINSWKHFREVCVSEGKSLVFPMIECILCPVWLLPSRLNRLTPRDYCIYFGELICWKATDGFTRLIMKINASGIHPSIVFYLCELENSKN